MQFSFILTLNTVKNIKISGFFFFGNPNLWFVMHCLFLDMQTLFNGVTRDEYSTPDTSPSHPQRWRQPCTHLWVLSLCLRHLAPVSRRDDPTTRGSRETLGNSAVTAEGCHTGGCLIKLVPRLRLWETSAVQRGQKLYSSPSAKLFITSPSMEVWENAFTSI